MVWLLAGITFLAVTPPAMGDEPVPPAEVEEQGMLVPTPEQAEAEPGPAPQPPQPPKIKQLTGREGVEAETGRTLAARVRIIKIQPPPSHPSTRLGHHLPVGHRGVYRAIKAWNPASGSFVEARDRREKKERRAEDTRLHQRIDEVERRLGRIPFWGWLALLLAVLGTGLGLWRLPRWRQVYY